MCQFNFEVHVNTLLEIVFESLDACACTPLYSCFYTEYILA